MTALAADGPTVKTDRGKIQGKASSDGSVRIFLGIPYAAPPVGDLRWKAPQPAEKWQGKRDATAFGSRCMQEHPYADMIFRDPGISEDCLTLNVWTPAKDKHAKLPVMVWIYGGGYVTGGTSEPRQDGENLAKNGVVVVSMNYRLGIFGFFVSHELAAENEHHASGNYGLMDQSAALGWVKKNIAEFGGDPQNVTLFGESAGSFSVSSQMASPLSKDLIAKAIGESGGAFSHTGLRYMTMDQVATADEAFAAKAFGSSTLVTLRGVSADKLLEAANRHEQGIPRFGPDVDGYFLPEDVPTIFAEGKQAKVPLLAGWNKDEGTLQVATAPEKPTVESLKALAQKDFGASAPGFLKAYAAANDEEALRVAEDYSGDRFIAYSTWAWLEAQVKTGDAPVYRYKFDRESPGDPNHPLAAGAFHSDEIEYVFGVLDSRKGAAWKPEDYKLSKLMQTYWTNFAKTSDPNGKSSSADVPTWPRYDAAGGWQVMHLDADPKAMPDAHRDRDLFLQSFWNSAPTPTDR